MCGPIALPSLTRAELLHGWYYYPLNMLLFFFALYQSLDTSFVSIYPIITPKQNDCQ